jgi:hypothetical protein
MSTFRYGNACYDFPKSCRNSLEILRYHVELLGQISERSSSIVFFINELENIKK